MTVFVEPGARWRTVAWGPVGCAVGALVELASGPVHVLGWTLGAVVLAAASALQVLGARRTLTVVVDDDVLQQGEAALARDQIVTVLPADPDGTADWQLATPLGSAATVPRRRTGIGLELADGRTVQAWARDDDGLRAALSG